MNYLIPKRINGTERGVVETMEADGQAVAVESLILVAPISLVVSRLLLDLFQEIVDREPPLDDGKESSRIPPRPRSRLFSRYGGLIPQRIARYLGYDPPDENLLELLLAAAVDPNLHRPSLIEDVQHSAFGHELA